MVGRTKVIGISAAVVIGVGVVAWRVSRPDAPAAAVHEPGQAVIDESEMSSQAFKERRRKMVEANRAREAGEK